MTAVTIAGVSYAFPVVGVTIAAISITHDLAEHNYTGLVFDTLGIVLPGVSKLARSGVGLSEAIDAVKDFHATSLLNFSEAAGHGSRQLSLAGGAGNASYTAEKLTSESISSSDDISRLGKTFLKSTKSGKPKNAPDVKKWIAKGGKIDVDNEGIWAYTNPDGVSVGYPGGFPDFKSAGFVRQEVNIGPIKGYSSDFALADETAPLGNKLETSTWHHYQDAETMQEVPTIIHKEFTHRGGMSIMRGINR